MKHYRMQDMTVRELQEYLKSNQTIIIPYALCEQHGFHLPLDTDIRNAEFCSKALAEKLAAVEISIAMQATEDDQLFGSVTSRMVAEELKKQGYDIEHNRVTIEPAIKTLGSFEAEVKLHSEVTAPVKLWVVRG